MTFYAWILALHFSQSGTPRHTPILCKTGGHCEAVYRAPRPVTRVEGKK